MSAFVPPEVEAEFCRQLDHISAVGARMGQFPIRGWVRTLLLADLRSAYGLGVADGVARALAHAINAPLSSEAKP